MQFLSPRLKWIDKNARGKKILDIGFIADEDKKPLAHMIIRKNNPESYIVGLDQNEKKIKEYNFPNSVVGDARELPFKDKSFDAVILCEIAEHIIELYPVLQEVSRVLEKGGKLYLTTPNPFAFFPLLKHWFFKSKIYTHKNYRSFLGDKDHKILWEPLSLCNILKNLDLEVNSFTTKNIAFPYLPSFFSNIFDINLWPFNKMGGYYCLIAEKK